MNKLRVGIAGLGTVGGGLLRLFADPVARVNEKLQLVAVSARDRTRDRGVEYWSSSASTRRRPSL